jgi:predicted transcriptional regulator YdeE
MSKPTTGGDRGDPVYSGAAAYGIVTARDPANGKMVYSIAANVQLNTATNICISSAC